MTRGRKAEMVTCAICGERVETDFAMFHLEFHHPRQFEIEVMERLDYEWCERMSNKYFRSDEVQERLKKWAVEKYGTESVDEAVRLHEEMHRKMVEEAGPFDPRKHKIPTLGRGDETSEEEDADEDE